MKACGDDSLSSTIRSLPRLAVGDALAISRAKIKSGPLHSLSGQLLPLRGGSDSEYPLD